MRYDVQFTSQYEGITDPAWQWRGCGIVALKMVLDYWNGQRDDYRTAPVSELWRAGMDAGAYREGIGWVHGGIASVARSYGYRSYNRDLAPNGSTPMKPEEALRELTRALEQGPVLASVYSGMDPGRGGGHIVVVTGIEEGLVSFNDPEQNSEREGKRTIAVRTFREAFKQRYICVLPGR
jgi:hypothetical protein